VALKLIRVDEIPASQHERLMKRFEREAKAMAKFSHPNIVPVYDYGEVDGSPYLVMEYIPGGTLKDKTGKPVPVETALSWIAPIADALTYAHESGIVHRDVKPSNILFDQKGRPILTDFGIAKVLETGETNLTGTGLGVGTPEYMAPEQWRGKASEATDQYSLGIVLYELLTGQKPYKADTPAALVILQATEPMPQPSKLVKGIPDEVEKVLYKALARDPQDRYEDMEALRKALESLFSGYTELPGEANNEELVDVVDEILEEKTPKNSSLSASEIEHIELKANPIESHNELKGEEETFDVLDSSPSNEMKIHNNVQEDMNKGQDGYSMGTHPKESP
jgi:serine/threonine protein kinase